MPVIDLDYPEENFDSVALWLGNAQMSGFDPNGVPITDDWFTKVIQGFQDDGPSVFVTENLRTWLIGMDPTSWAWVPSLGPKQLFIAPKGWPEWTEPFEFPIVLVKNGVAVAFRTIELRPDAYVGDLAIPVPAFTTEDVTRAGQPSKRLRLDTTGLLAALPASDTPWVVRTFNQGLNNRRQTIDTVPLTQDWVNQGAFVFDINGQLDWDGNVITGWTHRYLFRSGERLGPVVTLTFNPDGSIAGSSVTSG